MGANTQIILQALQGVLGVAGALSSANAAQELADREVQELERQKEEEARNARSKRSDRAREADRATGSMIAAMADNGGAGTANASAFAGEIGFMAGVDAARITGNSMSLIAALTAQQAASRARAANASTRASGALFSAIIGTAGGISTTLSTQRARMSAQSRQKQTAKKK